MTELHPSISAVGRILDDEASASNELQAEERVARSSEKGASAPPSANDARTEEAMHLDC